MGDAAAAAAERVGRPHHERQAQVVGGAFGVGEFAHDRAARHAQADLLHGGAEGETILGAADGLVVGADHLDLPAVEHAGIA